RREADDVDEEHRDDPALLAMRRRPERRAAVEAEAREVWVLLTATGANRHAPDYGVTGGHLPRAPGKTGARHPARGQGPLRYGGIGHDLRLLDLRRARTTADGRGRAPARGRGLRRRRQDEPSRVRVRGHIHEPALRLGSESG